MLAKTRSLRIKHKIEKTLTGHLEDLRWTLVRCFCAVIVCAIPCGIFWREIFEFITSWTFSLSDPAPQLIFTAPADAVVFIIKVALTCGFILASPFIFQQLWRFIVPALYKKEKTFMLPGILASIFCFFAGVVFSFYFFPIVLRFLVAFASGLIEPLFRVNEYFGFLLRMCIVLGLAFELPVISYVLSKAGIINYSFLTRYLRHAIVTIFILAAILTPPDLVSQMLFAMPLIILYLLSILISYLTVRKNNKYRA